jgi:hypothetical protein
MKWSLASLVLACTSMVLAQQSITVDWTSVVGRSKLLPTLQVVVNPMLERGSAIHDQIFTNLASLQSHMTRYVPWFPYPRYAVAELDAPSIGQSCGHATDGYAITLSCDTGTIANVLFASYGTPNMNSGCGSYTRGTCHAANSADVIESQCIGKKSCSVTSSVYANLLCLCGCQFRFSECNWITVAWSIGQHLVVIHVQERIKCYWHPLYAILFKIRLIGTFPRLIL